MGRGGERERETEMKNNVNKMNIYQKDWKGRPDTSGDLQGVYGSAIV